MQVMINRFKDAQLETNQPIEFESDQVEFKLLNSSDGLWIVKVMNSSVVSVACVNINSSACACMMS